MLTVRSAASGLAGLTLSLLLAAPSPGFAECTVNSIVSPGATGEDGDTLLANFETLVDDLYASDAVQIVQIGGEDYIVPPWFSSSTECAEANLKDGEGEIPSPSFDDFAVNGDELSELALVTALADDSARMSAIDRTIGAMESPTFSGMPCWLARVQTGPPATIECIRNDTATDVTARIGLAYYHAAVNPHFPQAERDVYLQKANDLAALHLDREYAHNEPFHSSVTGSLISDWVGGGATTAMSLDGLVMWIGYHQDVALFLLAAYQATGDSTYLERAEDVVDQWLVASGYDGSNLSFGCLQYKWNTSGDPLVPIPNWSPCTDDGLAWDDSDAPRALWIGHTLRARDLVTSGAPPSGAFADLADWIELLIGTGTQTSTTACIQYNLDGSEISGNCGTDYYYNGLGAGLVTYSRPTWLQSKLDTILPQYGWSANKTWNSAACFGIYRGIRPVKALAAALGLESSTYGGVRPEACIPLDVSRTGDGAGFVQASVGGIDCGKNCSEDYALDTEVTLEPTAYESSAFSGWSGDGCASGVVTLDQARSCTADFTGACDPSVDLTAQTVDTLELFAGCEEITAGDGFVVGASGDVTFRAGTRIVLRSGFSVASGGKFEAIAGAEP